MSLEQNKQAVLDSFRVTASACCDNALKRQQRSGRAES
jgi:hypothetical protein